jgi:quercetin dioxygenase-like cupin family protein
MSSLLIALLALMALTQSGNPGSTPAHTFVQPDTLVWKPLRPGAETAVVAGDPAKAGPFVMRFRYHGPARIPPHWHPGDEHITVLAGTFSLGMGEKADETKTTDLNAGGYALLPAKMPHYAFAKGEMTILQVHGNGPFTINYVNPADDPNRAK